MTRDQRVRLLRQVQDEDLEVLFEHQREPEGNTMAAFPPRDRDAFMAHWRENVLRNGIARTIVVDGEVAGNVVSWIAQDKRLVGYWIGKAFWGRGIATGALREFIQELERPLYAYVAVTNVASIRVLEKCGFQRAGDVIRGDVDEILMRCC